MEKYILEKKLPDSISRRIRSFYNTRNYQFAWFTSKGLTEQARGFWNLHDYHTTYNHDSLLHNKTLQRRMDDLIAEEGLSISATNKTYIKQHVRRLLVINTIEEAHATNGHIITFVPILFVSKSGNTTN